MDKDHRGPPDGPYAEDLPDPDGKWLSGRGWAELQEKLARAERDRSDAGHYAHELRSAEYKLKQQERELKTLRANNLALCQALAAVGVTKPVPRAGTTRR